MHNVTAGDTVIFTGRNHDNSFTPYRPYYVVSADGPYLEVMDNLNRRITCFRSDFRSPFTPVPVGADSVFEESSRASAFAATPPTTDNPKDLIGSTKVPIGLFPPIGLAYGAMAMADGAAKYGAYNWRGSPIRATVYLNAAMRHILAFQDGEVVAGDSGVHHLGHAMACCAILLDAASTGNLKDDRPTPGAVQAVMDAMAAQIKARKERT